jgi:hypothetical protein
MIVSIDATGTAFRTRILGMHFLSGGLAGAVIGTVLPYASTWVMRSLA